MKNELAVIVEKSGLDKTKAQVLLDNFSGYFQVASEWEKKAKTIIVTNAGQKVEMHMARVARLFLREKRISIEKTRKELKEQSLREGKAIDGIANILKALIVPIEEYLEKQEKFVEIKAAEIAELARVEMERKAEEDRLAEEEAEKKEQKRIRLENERLKKEAATREKKMKAEREKAEAKQRILEEKARKEKAEAERKARAEKERQEKILAEQRVKAETERRTSQQKARKAIEKQQVKLEAERKEREKIQAKLDKQIECPFCHRKFTLERGKL